MGEVIRDRVSYNALDGACLCLSGYGKKECLFFLAPPPPVYKLYCLGTAAV